MNATLFIKTPAGCGLTETIEATNVKEIFSGLRLISKDFKFCHQARIVRQDLNHAVANDLKIYNDENVFILITIKKGYEESYLTVMTESEIKEKFFAEADDYVVKVQPVYENLDSYVFTDEEA